MQAARAANYVIVSLLSGDVPKGYQRRIDTNNTIVMGANTKQAK